MLITRSRRFALWGPLLVCALVLIHPPVSRARATPSAPAARPAAAPTLPLSFVPNRGQADAAARFLAQGLGGTILFTPREVMLALPAGVVRVRFSGAQPQPAITAAARQPGVVNYLVGADPARWQTRVPTYGSLRYHQLYPGIDLRYDGQDGRLKGTYLVAPGADPARIRWQYHGATNVRLAADGSLRIALSSDGGARQTLTESAPIAWQTIGGQRRPVAVSYRLEPDGAARFALGAYDRSRPLVIDPTLSYSTFLGGSGNDFGYGIAVDSSGSAYVAGETASLNFPTAAPLQSAKAGGIDAFVAKLNPAGTALVYSTYLGGSATDRAYGIAVDGSGSAYLVGTTSSTDFPTANPIQASNAGLSDVFVARLNSSGSALLFSTYLGGGNYDDGRGIALDGDGRAAITGDSTSIDFPTVAAFQPTFGGGSNDAIVARLDSSGAALDFSTYLGGSTTDSGNGVALDGLDRAYLTGSTSSANFPTANALQGSNAGGIDAFAARLTASGAALDFSTYLGGSNTDVGHSIAVDGEGGVHLTGYSRSTNYPTASPIRATLAGNDDVIVSSLDATGTTLAFSSYLGGTSQDWGYGITADSANNLLITGYTFSSGFPTASPLQPTRGGFADAFVTRIAP